MPFIEHHCSSMPFLLAFDTSYEAWILVFGVSNTKNSVFGTPDVNALSMLLLLLPYRNLNCKIKIKSSKKL